jgi:hypothetical protein
MRFIAFAMLAGASMAGPAAELSLPLDKLAATGSMHLTCDSAEQAIDLPIPDRWRVNRVTATIHYTASMALDDEASQIVFLANGAPFALTRLLSSAPDVRVTLNVPVEYLNQGYNRLAFRVIQVTRTEGCESPCSPDKFTTINLADSSIDIEYENKPVPLALSGVAGFLFDPKTIPEARINLIPEDQTAESLTVTGIVASGVARRFDYRKVIFSVSREPVHGVDNIVIGKTPFVKSLLAQVGMTLGETATVAGHLKVFSLPQAGGDPDPTHALITVTGNGQDELIRAARTLANLSIGFPGSRELDAHKFEVKGIPLYGGREVLEANRIYDFKTLNFPTTTFRGINPAATKIAFRLPADFLIKQNLAARLKLNFSYGAGARGDSALNIVVNDHAVRAIRLGDPEGGFYEDYEVDIPTFLFQPGRNVIDFGIELHPAQEACPLLPGNLFVTMFETSTLTFPDMPHFVEMPKLELFMLNGFPFTRWPDGNESLVLLPEPTPEVIAAAMNLIGMVTQKNGFPLLSLRIGTKPPESSPGDILVVGRPATLPAGMGTRAPFVIGARTVVPYPIIRDWEGSYTFAHSTQTAGLGPHQGLLMEFESPYQAGRSVMLVGADDPADLLKLSRVLMEPEIQGQVRGGTVIIDMGPQYHRPHVTAIRAERPYTTGKGEDISALESFLYTHPMVYYALLVILVAALAWALYAVLMRHRMGRKLGRDASRAA